MMELDLLENVIVVQTLCGAIDLNFISVQDLEEIAYIAEEYDIVLPEYDLDGLYNDDYDDLVKIYKEYMNTLNDTYLELKAEILNKINKMEEDKMDLELEKGFEYALNHPGKGLTGIELSNSIWHDDIIMIRCIQWNASKIVKDPACLFPVVDKKMIEHIYKEYCSTTIDIDNLRMGYIREAINLAFLRS